MGRIERARAQSKERSRRYRQNQKGLALKRRVEETCANTAKRLAVSNDSATPVLQEAASQWLDFQAPSDGENSDENSNSPGLNIPGNSSSQDHLPTHTRSADELRILRHYCSVNGAGQVSGSGQLHAASVPGHVATVRAAGQVPGGGRAGQVPPEEYGFGGGPGENDDTGVEPDDTDPGSDPTWLAREIARIKCTTFITDEGISKMCKLFLTNMTAISELLESKMITTNYRHGIKPRSQIVIPKLTCALKVRQRGAANDFYVHGLSVIPARFLRCRVRVGTRWRRFYTVLRQECHTSLPQIRAHYERLHPRLSRSQLDTIYKSAAFGIDGVSETNKGKRTLILVTLKLKDDIFLWRCINPLKGVKGAKPSPEELLRSGNCAALLHLVRNTCFKYSFQAPCEGSKRGHYQPGQVPRGYGRAPLHSVPKGPRSKGFVRVVRVVLPRWHSLGVPTDNPGETAHT